MQLAFACCDTVLATQCQLVLSLHNTPCFGACASACTGFRNWLCVRFEGSGLVS